MFFFFFVALAIWGRRPRPSTPKLYVTRQGTLRVIAGQTLTCGCRFPLHGEPKLCQAHQVIVEAAR